MVITFNEAPNIARCLDRLHWAKRILVVDSGSTDETLQIVRTTAPPTVDGVLDPAEWAAAARLDDLHQVTPLEYATPSERTEVFVLYDDDALYVAARLHDTAPQQLIGGACYSLDRLRRRCARSQ